MASAGRATAGRAPKLGKDSPSADAAHGHVQRMDIQFLRVIGLITVLTFHFSPGMSLMPHGYIGVDVFFTISGFVITQQMLRHHDRGTVTYIDFLARRVRRLLPSSILVLVVVVVVILLFANPVLARDEARSGAAAMLYVANFYFASLSVDYFAQDYHSAFIHFWSLSVEEQFYVVWPLIFIGTAAATRRRPEKFLKVLGTVTAIAFLISLVGAAFATADDPVHAFFMPWWRGQQLMIGALVAIALHLWKPSAENLSPGVRTAAAIARPLCVVWMVFLVLQSAFPIEAPGWQSMYVSLPTAFILATAWIPPRDHLSSIGSWPPFAWAAAASYVVYLWHWPLWLAVDDKAPDGTNAYVLILVAFALSLAAGWVTHKYVEVPIKDGPRVRSFKPSRVVFVGVSSCVILAIAFVSIAPGVTAQRTSDWTKTLKPSLKAAAGDRAPGFFEGCFTEIGDDRLQVCREGAPAGKSKIMLVGDSHATQWEGAMNAAAAAQGSQLVVATKGSCSPWEIPTPDPNNRKSCSAWRDKMIDLVRTERPDVLIVSTDAMFGLQDTAGRSESERVALLEGGMRRTLERLVPLAGEVVVLEDTPLAAKDPISCLSTAGSAAECSFPNAMGVPERGLVPRVAGSVPGVTVVNPYPEVCPGATCEVVRDNTVMFTDSAHLSNTYAKTLTPWLSGWLGDALAAARTS